MVSGTGTFLRKRSCGGTTVIRRKIFIFIDAIFLGIVLISAPACKSKSGQEGDQHPAHISAHKHLYHCPMHPTYTSEKPGDCPICSMKLVVVEEADQGESIKRGPNKKIKFYRHPMRPDVTSPAPRKDEMGMDYLPVYEGEEESSLPVQGHATIKMSPEREQLIGVKTESATFRNLKKVIRASARVAYDTELYNAITEYKEALLSKEKLKESPWPDVQERSSALVRASALKLRQLGISQSQIENLNNDYHDPTNLLLGEKGESVWVYAQIYEFEAGLVQAGQSMEITSPALPGKKFFGSVKSVDSILNSESRSLKVRAQVPNPEGLLKPEMYMDAKIFVDLGWKLSIPEEAVLNTGERQIVFVAAGEGKYEPREVRLGREAEGYYELLSGVSKNEKVVTSANFLIDSESKLKAAVSADRPR